MALVLKDRVKETTTTVGTGTLTLDGAETGYQAFSVIGNGNTTYYAISSSGSEWEVGIGTYTASGTTLSRDTILASSNSGSVVTLSAGEKSVYVVYPAGKSVNLDSSGNVVVSGTITGANIVASNGLLVHSYTVNTSYSIPSGSNAIAAGPMTVASGATVTIPSGSRWLVL